MVERLGVVNDVIPVASANPPDDAPYQSMVSPEAGLADMVTVPAAHRELSNPVGGLGVGFTASVAVQEL